MIFSLIRFKSLSERVLSSACNETFIAMDFLSGDKLPPSKTSNIFTILLIFLETGINFIYYSILNTLRAKGPGKNRYTDEL